MRIYTLPRCLIGVALGAAAATVGFGSAALRSADVRDEFRRPPLVDHGDASRDPVWRLGQRLFFDTGLSKSGATSCATCHKAAVAWSDADATATGDNGDHLPFKAPTLFNVGWLDRLGWTGRFADTPAVSLFAMNSPATMNMPLTALVEKLRDEQSYRADFKVAFAHERIMNEDVGAALARYVNAITSAPSPFDKWIEGNANAIEPAAQRGFAIFVGKGRCSACHSGWTFTDGSFHDIGTAETDLGRGKSFPGSVKLQHAFKTPGLRGVADRAPYMHDGHLATLDDVIELYDRGGISRPSRAEAIAPLHLTRDEKADLKAFLATLSSGTEFVLHDQPTN